MVWTIFWINVLTIAVAFKKRMILYALLNAVFLYLVAGQAFQIQAELERAHTITYLFNFMSDVGFDLALRYVLGISSISLLLALISQGYRRRAILEPRYSFAPGTSFYAFLFIFLVCISAVCIFAVVGLDEFLHSSRPGYQPGATIFICLFFLGIIPLLLKILLRSEIVRGDLACFLFAFAVTGAFSRINLILYLTAMLLAYFYEYGWAERPITFKLLAKILVFGGVAGVTFFGIGALHDAQNFVQGSLGDLVSYILANPEKSVLSLQYTYRLGVEGMSGITGVFTQFLSNPNSVHFDYGASSVLSGIVLSMPGFLKTYAGALVDMSSSLNWYPFSIIPTAAETFFMSFGWAAVILYPAAVYLLSWHLPMRAMAVRVSPRIKLISNILFACSIFFVRGSIAAWIAFSATYVVVICASWPFFRPYLRMNHDDKT